jgi:hypothetical protein
MITEEQFSRMALSFAGTEQAPHFERVDLARAPKNIVMEALLSAYNEVMKSKGSKR